MYHYCSRVVRGAFFPNRVCGDKKAVPPNSQNILNRLNVPADNWLKIINDFGKLFKGPVGTLQELTAYCEHLEKQRRHYCHAS
jgi:hypothetical protein